GVSGTSAPRRRQRIGERHRRRGTRVVRVIALAIAVHVAVERYVGGALRLPEIHAGLSTPAYLSRGFFARDLVERGKERQFDLWSLDRFAVKRRYLRGLLLGFAAFPERRLRDSVIALANVIDEAARA
ncbi:MAG: hypothetical protein HOV81_05350, partial [Kofleriaceae bacterium]|nr:hypothetical protein [Kofleriaceae bacterium]